MTPTLAAPLLPDNAEARRWAERELSEPEYQPEQPSAWDEFLDDLWEWIGNNLGDWFGGSDLLQALAIGLGCAILCGFVILIVRSIRRNPRVRSASDASSKRVVLPGAHSSADGLRTEAENALAAGDVDGCVIASVRALARDGIDRELLADEPSLTAHEVAVELGPRFPDHTDELRGATDLFDAVVYGNRHASQTSARTVLELSRTIARTRPVDDVRGVRGRLAVPR